MMCVARNLLALAVLGAAVAACGSGNPPPPVEARRYADPGFVAGGDYELHYGTVPSRQLAAEVAQHYGIDRNDGRLVVSVSVLRRRPDALPLTIEAGVSGSERGLVGEPAPLVFRPVREAGTISYIAEAPLRDGEVVVIELQAQPAGGGPILQARLTRQFAAE